VAAACLFSSRTHGENSLKRYGQCGHCRDVRLHAQHDKGVGHTDPETRLLGSAFFFTAEGPFDSFGKLSRSGQAWCHTSLHDLPLPGYFVSGSGAGPSAEGASGWWVAGLGDRGENSLDRHGWNGQCRDVSTARSSAARDSPFAQHDKF
jgi:hypothetical protein